MEIRKAMKNRIKPKGQMQLFENPDPPLIHNDTKQSLKLEFSGNIGLIAVLL